jgi:hypothetical protein
MMTGTMRRAIATIAPFLVTGCMFTADQSGTVSSGPPFSGEIVSSLRGKEPPARIYVSDGKLRLEYVDAKDGGALVSDPAHGRTLLINEKAHQYIDAGAFGTIAAVGFAQLVPALQPLPNGDPCGRVNSMGAILAAAINAQERSDPSWRLTCRAAGATSLSGRATHKWVMTGEQGGRRNASTIWTDDRLHIMTRMSDDSDGMEIRNIHEGPQPAALFEPPAGYQHVSLFPGLPGAPRATPSSTQSGAVTATQNDTIARAASELLQKLQKALR